jgi:hypothetical protein
VARLAFPVLLASLACLWGTRLDAATVMIVRPASPSAALTETVSRLHGEMLSVGLTVMIAERAEAARTDGTDGASARAWLERMAVDGGIDAAIDVIGDGRVEAADIWVFRPAPRPPQVIRVLAEGDVENAPARLAIRAIDLLRSLLIESELAGASRRTAAAPAVTPVPPSAGTPEVTARVATDASPLRDGGRLGFELGAAVLASLDGVGPALLPLVRLDAALGPWLGLQLEAAGFGTRPTVGTPGSSARVAQQYALAGACVCAPSMARWQPVGGLSAGALRTTADGEADSPLQGHSVAQWSFVVEASAGARLRLARRTHLTAAVHVQLAEPYVDIRVVNAGPATTGRPNVLVTFAVGEWL